MLDFWHTWTSHEIGNATTRKLDPENIVVAAEILMLCHSFRDITTSG